MQAARQWLETQKFSNDNKKIKAYEKQFAVDKICAEKELYQMEELSPGRQKSYDGQVKEKQKKAKKRRQEKRHEKRKQKMQYEYGYEYTMPDQDENFAFIAGYTAGGFPYGISWAEMAEIERDDRLRACWGNIRCPWGWFSLDAGDEDKIWDDDAVREICCKDPVPDVSSYVVRENGNCYMDEELAAGWYCGELEWKGVYEADESESDDGFESSRRRRFRPIKRELYEDDEMPF